MKEINYYIDKGATFYREWPVPASEPKEIVTILSLNFVWTHIAEDQTMEKFLKEYPDAQYTRIPFYYHEKEIDWSSVEWHDFKEEGQ